MLPEMTKDLAAKPPSMAIPFSHRKVDSVGALFPKSRHELSMPNLFEGAKEVSLPLLRDLQVDIN
jgi:hypothetical protein